MSVCKCVHIYVHILCKNKSAIVCLKDIKSVYVCIMCLCGCGDIYVPECARLCVSALVVHVCLCVNVCLYVCVHMYLCLCL